MIRKIILKNFMAHEHTVLELGPGVNALTGPNNTGKSAIVEALRCVATNPIPKYYIRHGAKVARVELEFDNGTRVVWVRKKRSSGYELWHPGVEEPVEYWKFGRKPPEDVLAALRLDQVALETGGEVDVHVGNQREPVFLLNQPGSNAAAFFAASTESAHLLAMQNLLKRKTTEATSRERELKARLTGVTQELDAYLPLPDIEVHVETARELGMSATRLQEDIPALEKTLASERELGRTLEIRRAVGVVFDSLQNVPKIHDTSRLSLLITQLQDVATAAECAVERRRTLSGLCSVPQVYDTAALATVCNQLQRHSDALQGAHRASLVTASLCSPPELNDMGQLSVMLDELIAVTYRERREERRCAVLRNIAEPPPLTSVGPLEGLLESLHVAQQDLRAGAARLADLENKLKKVRGTIEEHVAAIGCCPTCGGDMNAVAFLDRRCRHDA